jgi:hypothetical protein
MPNGHPAPPAPGDAAPDRAGGVRGVQLAGEALLAAALVFAASCLVQTPFTQGFSFGLTYQAMAEQPFAWQGLFPHRVLLPLLAHATGLTGPHFHLAAHGTALLFLILVHIAARRFGAGPLDALLATAVAGFGGAVQLYKSHVGYPDALSFAGLLGAVLLLRHPMLCWLVTLLSAFAHEQAFFFAPLLWWLRCHHTGAPWHRDLPWLAGIAVAYGAFRWYVAAHTTPAAIAPGYYFGNGYFPLGFLGVLYLATVQVVLVFGPFVPLLGWLGATRRAAWERTAVWLLLAGIVGIYGVAHDFNRFVNFLFLPLLVACVRWTTDGRRRLVLVAMVALQALSSHLVLMPITERFYLPMAECQCLTGEPAKLPLLVTYVLPRVWPWVAGAVVLLAALLALGVHLARRGVQPVSARTAV